MGSRAIGLMSATSGDGVDAALVSIRGRGFSLRVTPLAFEPYPYPASLRKRVLSASQNGTVAEICHLNAVLGEVFATAALRVIQAAGLRPTDVQLIGSHGQTVHHLPKVTHEPGVGMIRSTLQIAEPAVIAERTGITTVADFRPRDIAAGGQGAPLTPYAHYLLLRNPRRSRLIVNLGGISNVTYLPAGCGIEAVRAFDTGPGNMILDALVQRLTGGRRVMDRDGRMAARGTVDATLLDELSSHPFLRRRPPKSTGREEFGQTVMRRVLEAKRRRRLTTEDLLATCSRFTALAVGAARRWLQGPIDEVIVGGGGARNRTLLHDLAEVFTPAPVRVYDEIGWDSKAFEAVAFAVLAYQTLHGEPANVPAATGASHAVVLGAIVPGAKAGFRPWIH
ncbi:MAG TPA: anhydro-N-acetylmuramic acid kinase [Candidatus Acidoferrum sp.]|nr:anhydro-N-acetylmuramic acid kinase [Candidatus Acidoferrum sp.]